MNGNTNGTIVAARQEALKTQEEDHMNDEEGTKENIFLFVPNLIGMLLLLVLAS